MDILYKQVFLGILGVFSTQLKLTIDIKFLECDPVLFVDELGYANTNMKH